MRVTYLLSTMSGFMNLRLAATSPIWQPYNLPRQANICTDSLYPFDASCWTALDLNGYLTNWNQTQRVCDDSPTCCQPGEIWSTCFIRLSTNGTAQDDCSTVANNECASEPVDQVAPPGNASEVRYILHNIYYLHEFFNNWYNSLTIATLVSLLSNQPIINEVDPTQQTKFILGDILTALSAGLAFLGAPEVAPELEATIGTASKVLLTGIQQAPSVAKAIWPEGTINSQSVQLADLDTDLSQIYANFTQQINNTLYLLMSDVPSFLAFASAGAFSGPDELSLPGDATLTAFSLQTYIISTAMAGNHWHASLQFNGYTKAQIEKIQLERGGATCSFGANNICTDKDHSINIWYSEVTSRAYLLTVNRQPNGPGPTPFQLMTDIVNKQWSTLEVLFDGGYNCTAAGEAGQSLNFDSDSGNIDFSCMSQMAFCIPVEAGKTHCPVAEIDGVCPFAACSTLN